MKGSLLRLWVFYSRNFWKVWLTISRAVKRCNSVTAKLFIAGCPASPGFQNVSKQQGAMGMTCIVPYDPNGTITWMPSASPDFFLGNHWIHWQLGSAILIDFASSSIRVLANLFDWLPKAEKAVSGSVANVLWVDRVV